MKLPFVTGYFALILAGIAFVGLSSLLIECRHEVATPFTYFGFALCLGLLGLAQRLWLLRRWALIVFTMGSLMGVIAPLSSYFCLINAVMGMVVLAFRWHDLRTGI